jgi:uncharacterized membrane protein
MTRDAFLHTLRSGLVDLPPRDVEDIVADYAAHFADSSSSGRSEEEVAAALGDPARIARELRAEAGLRRFEAQWSLGNLVTAVMALGGLALIDLLFLLPLLVITIAVALAMAIALIAIGLGGLKIIFTALFHLGGPVNEIFAQLFIGAGLVSGFVGGGALLLIGLGAGVRVLGRYARLHFRLARPDHA